VADRATLEDGDVQELSLETAADFLLNECRMVLPGIQSLFGFQLIAVFSSGFSEKLTVPEQHLHLLAIALIAISVALIMTPAALHRRAGSRVVTETLIRVSSRMLLASMIPLALGTCIDFYLVARILLDDALVPALAAALLGLFVVLWFVLPRVLIKRA